MITLAAAKIYLRTDIYVDGNMIANNDDPDVERMITAACDHLRSINVDMTIEPMPPAIEQAVLLLVGHFYKYREATSDYQHFPLNLGVDRLVAPFREYSL